MKFITTIFTFLLCCNFIIAQNWALSFDGNNEYINVPHNATQVIDDDFTIEAWIFASEWRSAQWQGSIVNKDGTGDDRGFAFRCGDGGILSFVASVNDVWEEAATSQIMNENQWYHVAVVVNNGTIKLYIDGQESASHSYTGTPTPAPDLAMNIGASPGFGGRHFNGVIDEVRIWDDARTATELADFKTVDLVGDEDNLIAYFPMNEGTGNIAGDQSATASNGGLVQMDESNWVEGYTLPDFDISVQDVYGVDIINMIDRPIKLKVDILNTGLMSLSDIDLTVKVNGDVYTTETVESTINSTEQLTYEFIAPLDLIGLTDPEITVEATHPQDGNTLNNSSELSIVSGTSDQVIISDKVLHKNGVSQNSIKMTLPNDLHKYEQILLNIDLTCPVGGCGPWDVLADLKAVTDIGTFELARYITPYGVACGGWVVDITDFKDVIGGEVEFLTSIVLYTEQGWLLDMSVDLIDNNSTDTYSKVSKLWEKSYQVYGDPGISHDLAPIDVDVDASTENSHVRMTITGHGQGNTSNAAEFLPATHSMMVDGNLLEEHFLWKSDCAQNPCDNQAGTWPGSRAGWCPGQEVTPAVFNAESMASAGTTVSLDYELMDYVNLLNTGYNNSSHTEPYYRIYSYFVEHASVPFKEYSNLEVTIATSSNTNTTIESVSFTLLNNGFDDLSNFSVNVYHNNELVLTENYPETLAIGDSVEKTLALNTTITGTSVFVEVVHPSDDNPGDNIAKSELTTANEDLVKAYKFDVFPNPTIDGKVLLQYDEFWSNSVIKVYTTTGQLISESQLFNTQKTIYLEHQGIYFYDLRHPENGASLFGKIIFQE